MAGDVTPGDLSILLQAVQEFHDIWFPKQAEPDSVQSFWFGAKRPRDRKLFRRLCPKFWAPLRIAESLYESQPDQILKRLDCTSQLHLAIFLDQQSRNQRAMLDSAQDVQGEEATEVESQIARCSKIARRLANNILQIGGCSVLMERIAATHAEICFFSLVLRHTRDLEDVRMAQQLLNELQNLGANSLVSAFQQRNAEVLAQLESEAYVREALEGHTPWKASCNGSRPCTTVCLASSLLDSCRALSADCLAWASLDKRWDELATHPLCLELQNELERRSLLTPATHLLLSYSGGVDSTAHLILLLALKRRMHVPRISCLLLSYPNRQNEEVEAEKQWAAWVCNHLEVDLYIYDVQLTRPHTDVSSEMCGLCREDYERFTKEIRFKMYRCLLQPSGEHSAVVLGHHQDDVDENRLDHLMKGHVLGDVEGMWAWRRIHDVQLCRPLLHKRKADFLGLLKEFPTPFFRDSTPPWSVRGATRAALDALGPEVRGSFVLALQNFGRLSLEVGSRLDQAVGSWVEDSVQAMLLPRGASGVVLNLDALFAQDVGSRLAEVESVIADIRQVWNSLVSGLSQPSENVTMSSPISGIPENSLNIPALLFERGFFAAAQTLVSKRPGHYHSSECFSINRKAVHHLLANIQNCTKPHFGGGLTQECLACKIPCETEDLAGVPSIL